ncbi:hypothetical protein JCGZ_19355 [Jatropha curcas]|uniref:Uncharacterized protein n=1 Tax=Jatropha curcas TaxID=180498 RepID=A0A067KCM2_JATCU|nr:hypothetical protein JCGZ_19355 [Jatropha curcas]
MDIGRGVEDSAQGDGIEAFEDGVVVLTVMRPPLPPLLKGDARPKFKIVKGRFHPSSNASKAITRIFKLHLEKDG